MALVKGIDVLSDKLPELLTPRGLLRVAVSFGVPFILVMGLLFFLQERWLSIFVLFQLLVYLGIWFLLRDFFAARLPYSEGFFNRLLPAAGMNLSSVVFIFFTEAPSIDGVVYMFPGWLRLLVFAYLAISALALFIGAIRIAGVDTLSGAYMYFPDEGEQIHWSAYDVVRHPAYSGLARLALGFGILHGTPFHLLLAVFFVFAWMPRWRDLEEAELLRRFGENYREYAERVPPLFPGGVGQEIELLRGAVASPARPSSTET